MVILLQMQVTYLLNSLFYKKKRKNVKIFYFKMEWLGFYVFFKINIGSFSYGT